MGRRDGEPLGVVGSHRLKFPKRKTDGGSLKDGLFLVAFFSYFYGTSIFFEPKKHQKLQIDKKDGM